LIASGHMKNGDCDPGRLKTSGMRSGGFYGHCRMLAGPPRLIVLQQVCQRIRAGVGGKTHRVLQSRRPNLWIRLSKARSSVRIRFSPEAFFSHRPA
jgi:hypothetical protein